MLYLVPILKSLGCLTNPMNSDMRGWIDGNGKQKFPTNVSTTYHKNHLVFNTRLTDYMYVPMGNPNRLIYISNNEHPGSVSCNDIHDSTGNHIIYETEGTANTTLSNGISYKGLEDVRLVVWDDTLYGIGFRPDIIAGKVIPQFIEFNDDFSFKHTWFLNTNKYMEKNWQPIYDEPFTFMYDPDNAHIVKLDIESLEETSDPVLPVVINDIDTPDFTGRLCGSTQVVTLPDETHISICHTSHRYLGFDQQMHWIYNHYFVLYDKDMQNKRISIPFHFIDDCMEFTCGMCMAHDNIVITFTLYDGAPQVISIPINTFMSLIDTIMNHPSELKSAPDIEYITNAVSNPMLSPADKFLYVMGMECHGIHAPIQNTLESIIANQIPNVYKKRILAYLITRRPDGNDLIKYYDKL